MRQVLVLILACGLVFFSTLGTASAGAHSAQPLSLGHACDHCDTEMRATAQMGHGSACAFMPGCLVTAEPVAIKAPVPTRPMHPVSYQEAHSRPRSHMTSLNPPPPRS
ncbi:MAG TPA: hypothetical protein DEO85_15195 [Maritimibacter sp.]|nr:hypothetical protein [Maritimibacter sp.]